MTKKEVLEFCLAYEAAVRRALYERKNDKINVISGGTGGRCKISDPTAEIALHNLAHINWVWVEYGEPLAGNRKRQVKLYRPAEWLSVITKVNGHFSGSRYETLIDLRWHKGRGRQEICKKLKISPALMHTMLKNIEEYAFGVADGMGL